MTEIETIRKIVRDMLASHDLEAVLVVRDRNSKEVLYEVGHTNIGLEDQVTIRHVVGDFEVSEV
jgi:hypothetical protein